MSKISLTSQDIRLLEIVRQAGICMFVSMPTGGCIDIEPKQLPDFLRNEDMFWAKYYGVEINLYRRWLELRVRSVDGVQCIRLTAHKKQCKNMIEVPEHPRQFSMAMGMFCPTHGGYRYG